jgi:hypothetical protein
MLTPCRWVLTTTSFFFFLRTYNPQGRHNNISCTVFANDARKLDDEVLVVVFNDISGRKHGDDAVRVHRMYLPFFSFSLRISRGWRNVEKRPTLTIFFSWIWLTPSPPSPAKYSMFSEFQCFFSMFFYYKDLIFLDSCTDTLYPFDHKLIRSKSRLKVFCAQIFTHMWEITQNGKLPATTLSCSLAVVTIANTVTTATQTHLDCSFGHVNDHFRHQNR